jgi:hypothetical protein
MTEPEWNRCTDPQAMLDFLRATDRASDRKLRLFAVACCRRIWHLLVAEEQHWHKDEAAFWRRCQEAVVLAERFADGEATEQELAAVTAYPRPALYDADAAMFAAELPLDAAAVAAEAAEAAAREAEGRMYAQHFPDGYTPSAENAALLTEEEREYEKVLATEKKSQCDLLRCVFGNLFQPPSALDLSLLTPNVVGLVWTIYEERSFERTRELADVLEAAGCTDAYLLAHLRSPGPHVRGCFALDALIGRQ